MERKIRDALDNNRIYYNLQPQFDMDHKLRGFEALARMKDEDGNIISPVDFIPVAEKAGLVDRIDMLVLSESAKFVGALVKKTGSNIILNTNFSVHHLMRTGFVDEIKQVLEESGLPAKQLEIEMTESVMIDSVEKAIDCLRQIHALGVRVAIDDFGTGYSSLSYLQSFPADVIKIDRSFIIRMSKSEVARQFVTALIAISHVMKFEIIAEGVEEENQLAFLKEKGCDFIQGFIWGKPMDPQEAAKLV
jgi:EAL domain-containing protein (putative c-di-GMP-specific phosphodiesterase class I)